MVSLDGRRAREISYKRPGSKHATCDDDNYCNDPKVVTIVTLSASFLALVATLSTFGMGVFVLRLVAVPSLPHPLKLGLGYVVGVATVSLIVYLATLASFSLREASLFATSAGLCAIFFSTNRFLSTYRINRISHNKGGSIKLEPGWRGWLGDPFKLCLLSLLGLHLALSFGNNLSNAIFPWDAFTTWMYRAKVWVLTDTISTMAFTPDWISGHTESDYAIHAHHYPIALSIYPAFMSGLTGTWTPSAASLPWSVALLALAMSTYGTLRLAHCNEKLALTGAYFIASLPLANVHAALAGYGDLWISLSSGIGLTLLLVWTLHGGRETLRIGILALLVGAQFKTEGWLWLGLGFTFLFVNWLSNRVGLLRCLVAISCVCCLVWFSDSAQISLGPMGKWGIDEENIWAGPLGNFATRPYNPIVDYYSVVFEQGNFLLLGCACVLGLLLLTTIIGSRSVAVWVLLIIVALAQLIIFGLSHYSQYAESGTAITRILLQFTPIAIFIAVLGWGEIEKQWKSNLPKKKPVDAPKFVNGSVRHLAAMIFLTIASITAPVAKPLVNTLFGYENTALEFDKNTLFTAVGTTREFAAGKQFTSSPIGVGVLRAKLNLESDALPRYLVANVEMKKVKSSSFYWINEGEDVVNSISLDVSGRSVEDLNRYPAWLGEGKQEVGYLVNSNFFEGVKVKTLGLRTSIDVSTLPAIISHMTAPSLLTQRLINNSNGFEGSPIQLGYWFTLSFAALSLFSIPLLLQSATYDRLKIIGGSCLALWVLHDVSALSTSALINEAAEANEANYLSDPRGEKLIELASSIFTQTGGKVPVLILHTGDESKFAAHKLPFLLLPQPSAPEGSVQTILDLNWRGAVVILGANDELLGSIAMKLEEELDSVEAFEAEGYTLIIPQKPL